VLKGDDVGGPGIIGTFSSCDRPGHAYGSAALITWAKSTGRSARGAFFFARGGPARISNAIAAPRANLREIRPRRQCAHQVQGRNTARRPASCSRTARVDAGMSFRASITNLTFLKFLNAKELPGEFLEEWRAHKYRGSSGKVNLALDAPADFTWAAWRRTTSARRDLDLAERRLQHERA